MNSENLLIWLGETKVKFDISVLTYERVVYQKSISLRK